MDDVEGAKALLAPKAKDSKDSKLRFKEASKPKKALNCNGVWEDESGTCRRIGTSPMDSVVRIHTAGQGKASEAEWDDRKCELSVEIGAGKRVGAEMSDDGRVLRWPSRPPWNRRTDCTQLELSAFSRSEDKKTYGIQQLLMWFYLFKEPTFATLAKIDRIATDIKGKAEKAGAGDRWPALLCKAFARQGGADPRAFCAETAATHDAERA